MNEPVDSTPDDTDDSLDEDWMEVQDLDPKQASSDPSEAEEPDSVESDASIKLRNEKAKAVRHEQANEMRQNVSKTSLIFIKWQLIASDTLVAIYVFWQLIEGHSVPSEILVAWMSSSLVEIIGILWVIARSLFPFHDKYRDKGGEKTQTKK